VVEPEDGAQAQRQSRADGRSGLDVGRDRRSGDPLRRRTKTSERIALELVHDIVAQGLRTGARLPLEAAMVERYGVSRASLREALRLLEVQGLIHIKPGPGGGPVVGAVDPGNLARTLALYFHLGNATYGELLEAQGLFETICAQLAARHPQRREALAPFLDAGDVHDPHDLPAFRATTTDFHATVYRLGANSVVALVTEAITHMVTSHVVATMDPIELRPAILHEHAELAQAIAGGRADEAATLMGDHFRAQHDYYRRRWPARLAELVEWR
jgi:DNA-binding FadR family transcriptional regulator